MALEIGSYIADLTPTNPLASDPAGQGDDHIRLIKTVLQGSLPNLAGILGQARVMSTSQTISSAYNMSQIVVGASITLTLPPSASITSGWFVDMQTIGSVVGTIQVQGAQSINGAATMTIPGNSMARIYYQGADVWRGAVWPSGLGLAAFGDVQVGGILSVSGATHLNGTASIGGAATLASTLSVSGATHLKSTVSIGGVATLASVLSVSGAAHFNTTVSIGGAATLASTLSVSGAAHFNGNVSIGGNVTSTVTISGATVLQSTLSVSGAAHFNTTVSIGGAATLGGTLSVSGAATLLGAATLASTLSVSGAAHFNTTASIGGAATLGGTLSVSGAATFLALVNAKASLSISGNATMTGNLTVGGTTTISGATTMLGTLTVAGAATISGTTVLQSLLTLNAGQIAFPATQNASAGANVLDDYEEGTWTPTLTFATPGDLSVTYSARNGTYTKVGRLVSVACNVTTSAWTHSTASGEFRVTGMPFTASSGNVYNALAVAITQNIVGSSNYTLGASVNASTAYAVFYFYNSGAIVAPAAVVAANLATANNVIIGMGGSYHAS